MVFTPQYYRGYLNPFNFKQHFRVKKVALDENLFFEWIKHHQVQALDGSVCGKIDE